MSNINYSINLDENNMDIDDNNNIDHESNYNDINQGRNAEPPDKVEPTLRSNAEALGFTELHRDLQHNVAPHSNPIQQQARNNLFDERKQVFQEKKDDDKEKKKKWPFMYRDGEPIKRLNKADKRCWTFKCRKTILAKT